MTHPALACNKPRMCYSFDGGKTWYIAQIGWDEGAFVFIAEVPPDSEVPEDTILWKSKTFSEGIYHFNIGRVAGIMCNGVHEIQIAKWRSEAKEMEREQCSRN